MNTILEKASKEAYKKAGEILRNGELVAFPTETVYGLGGNALCEDASKKIYAAKGRPSDNPLIVHIADKDMVYELATDISESAKKLMEKFWPGPLTLVFKKTDIVPLGTTGGLDTVAIRMPDSKEALELIKEANVPIAAPSANTSGRPSPTEASHVVEDLNGKIAMIIDGGSVGIGIESTIVDVSGDSPMILRPGYITKEMIESQIGKVLVDKVVEAKAVEEISNDDYTPKAPGMKYKHYAPKADFVMFEGKEADVIDAINKRLKEDERNGRKVGIICTDESIEKYDGGQKVSIGSRKDEESIARNLYGVLRKFDEMNVDCIYGETFYDVAIGTAIMNRLIKAAGYKIYKV